MKVLKKNWYIRISKQNLIILKLYCQQNFEECYNLVVGEYLFFTGVTLDKKDYKTYFNLVEQKKYYIKLNLVQFKKYVLNEN